MSTLNCESCDRRHLSFFCSFDDEELHSLSVNATSNVYKKGQIIFYEGNKPLGIYCVNSGMIKVHKLGDNGKDQILRLAKQTGILGYRAVVSGDYYTASATTLVDSTVCFIPRNVFLNIMEANPKVSIKMAQLLSNDLRIAETKITHLAQKPVRERLAETLMVLKDFYGLEADGQTLSVFLTRKELANFVGTATETIIRLLSDFKKDDLVDLAGRKILIKDIPGLVRMSRL